MGRRQGHGGAKKRPRQPGKTQLAERQSEKNRHFLFTSPQPRRVLTARPDAARRQREASFSAEHLLDVVQRAALHLLVNLADVSPTTPTESSTTPPTNHTLSMSDDHPGTAVPAMMA